MAAARDFNCYNITQLREAAQRRLPLGIWEYLERGTEDEHAMARNRASLDAVTFRPRIARDVSMIDMTSRLLGCESSFPLAVAPTGAAGIMAYNGDLALAKAAARAGVPFTISSASTMDLEQIASAGGQLWFQLYLWADRSLSHAALERAHGAGCQALLVTLDMAKPPNREYLQRNGFGTPFRLNTRNTLDVLAHPRWLVGVMGRYALSGGIPSQANLPDRLRNKVTQSAKPGALFKQDDLDWQMLADLRERWPGKFVLKGVLRADDAERAAAMGADGIVVSNHGGRALDGAIATIDALPDIVAAVKGKLEILFDSGIRRGTDVVRALAIGADGVLSGRAPLYGLARGGEEGVLRALELLREETARTMAMVGARNVGELDSGLLG